MLRLFRMMRWFTSGGGEGGRGEGGVSPDSFTANWLHVEGRGVGGGSVLIRSQERAAK